MLTVIASDWLHTGIHFYLAFLLSESVPHHELVKIYLATTILILVLLASQHVLLYIRLAKPRI